MTNDELDALILQAVRIKPRLIGTLSAHLASQGHNVHVHAVEASIKRLSDAGKIEQQAFLKSSDEVGE